MPTGPGSLHDPPTDENVHPSSATAIPLSAMAFPADAIIGPPVAAAITATAPNVRFH
ncbi:hypothetical protein [Nocardia alba]|uniref:hypothetical protein n=1 Tax=Nocardia alba TaxID=225051 RepID=UPI000AD5734E|nr:hypothetical protein [Nocardia alba]